MAEADEYDAIFAALKHPIRRQILLLLEEKGEVSFTVIENAVGIDNTGLLSYHLKELVPLVEQSVRGKYRLSEVGQASIALFRKVERERQRSSTAVRRELEKLIGEVVFLFFVAGITLLTPLSVDVDVSVQNLSTSNLSVGYMVGTYLVSFLGMIFGLILFVFYDRHYFSKNIKTNVVHSTIFAIGISLTLIYSAYVTYEFEQVAFTSNGGMTWPFSILRTVSFLVSSPLITYATSNLMKKWKRNI